MVEITYKLDLEAGGRLSDGTKFTFWNGSKSLRLVQEPSDYRGNRSDNVILVKLDELAELLEKLTKR